MTHNSSPKEKNLAQLTDRVVHIIGPRRFQNELMAFFLEREAGAKCIASEDIRHVPIIDNKNISQPKLILLDCLEKDLDSYLVELESSGENILYGHLVALFNVSSELEIEEKALKRGYGGFFMKRTFWSGFLREFMLFLTENCGFPRES